MDEHLAMLGHDLRSELSTIMGLSELIELASSERNEIREFAKLIQNHNHYMLDLVNGLVVSAKAGGVQPKVDAVVIGKLVLTVTKGLSFNQRHAAVVVDVVGHIPERIISDALLLRQILTNLIGNAVRYTHEGGVRVLLEHAPANQRLQITITDTGPGMSAEQLAQIFQPDREIHRAEPSSGRHGLGLWIARRLTDLLGGEITVRSLPGHGTAVAVHVPTGDVSGVPLIDNATVHRQDPASLLQSDSPRGLLTGLRILVADDTPSNRLFAATLLKRSAASVSLAVDGQDALDQWSRAQLGGRPFDIIILDQTMPKFSGSEVAAKLRDDGVTVPIFSWTADQAILDHLPDVFSGSIAKPATAMAFMDALTKVLLHNSSNKAAG